jgi:two-component system alkaline phosphatase synthesis response regulator PhoP
MSSKTEYKILVVDDEEDILELLKYNLQKEGYNVKTANNGIKAIEIVKSYTPDLVILDIMMPQQDGVETCRQIRDIPEMQQAFILFLTARAEEYSEIAAFDVGADDYIVKPIKPRALMSRISALFRRNRTGKDDKLVINVKDLVIDKSSYTVTKGEKSLTLPKKEFELLFFLAENPNKVHTRDELLHNIWGSDVYVLARTVDVHIRKVREKIGDGYISTLKGVGYKIQVN